MDDVDGFDDGFDDDVLEEDEELDTMAAAEVWCKSSRPPSVLLLLI